MEIRNRPWFAACIALLMLVIAAPMQADSSVSGVVTVNGVSVEPSHGVGLRTINRWTKEEVIKVVLAPSPLEMAGIDQALDRLEHITGRIEGDYAVVTLTLEGGVKMVYAYLDGRNYGMGTEIGEEISEVSQSRVVGRVFTAKPGDLAGSTYEYDLSFGVDMVPPRPPGEDLGGGGGAPGEAYVALQVAKREGDLETVIKHEVAYKAARLAEIDEEYRSDEVEYMKEDAYEAVAVSGGELFDGFAILDVTATDASGDSIEGQVKMVSDGDSWRVELEDVM